MVQKLERIIITCNDIIFGFRGNGMFETRKERSKYPQLGESRDLRRNPVLRDLNL